MSRQSRRLLQIGILLFLFTSFEGFIIPYLGSERIGLSLHTLSALQAIYLLIIGLIWTKLELSNIASYIAF